MRRCEKVEWCHKNLPMEKGISVSLVENKGLVYGRVLVDDYPPYVESWLKWRPRGLVIMPAHDHNVSFSHPNVIKLHWPHDGIKSLNQVEEAMRAQYEEIWNPPL